MPKIEVSLSSEYGIMFLYDSRLNPIFPTEAGKYPVMSTSTCLALSVLTYVDGEAKIILADVSQEQRYTEYFTGELKCPSNSISLYDHNGFAFASLPLRDGYARVSLRMSEETNADIVECTIENIEMF